jgi:transcription termination factor Rho
VTASGTRREDLLLSGDEVALTGKLRRGLAARGERAALDYVLGKLGDTPTNVEFLMQVQRDSSLEETSGAGN